MKKKVLLLIALLLPLMVGAKKLTYLGHQYDGKVNGQNIPEGKGKIDIGGLIIEGMFNGKTINDATLKTDWLKFDGSVEYGREDAVTLKEGGVLTKYYYQTQDIRVERNYNGWTIYESSLPGKQKNTVENLSQDKVIDNQGLQEEPLTLPFTFEMTGIPSELNPPIVKKKGEFPLMKYSIWTRDGRQEGYMYAYVANTQPGVNDFVEGYKDDEGRSWTYIGAGEFVFIGKREMQFFVIYPDGSNYVYDGSWTLSYPSQKKVMFHNDFYEKGRMLLLVNGDKYEEGKDVAVRKIGEITGLSDFLTYYSEQKKVTLPSGVEIIVPEKLKNMSAMEIEKFLQDNVFSIVKTSNLFAAPIYIDDRPLRSGNEYRSNNCLGRYVDGKFIPQKR